MPRLGVLVPTRDRVPAAHRPPAQEPAGDSSAVGSPPCCALLPLPHLMAAAPPAPAQREPRPHWGLFSLSGLVPLAHCWFFHGTPVIALLLCFVRRAVCLGVAVFVQ